METEVNLKTSSRGSGIHKQPFTLTKSPKHGLLIKIHHTVRAPTSREKHHRFTNASFNETGERLALIDQPGNIFVFDLAAELYWDLPKVGMCSLIIFNAFKKDEILVGRNDGVIYLISSESGEINGCLKGHTHPLRQVSFANGLPYCLTTTYEKAIVWDLLSNSQLHHLSLQTKISIKKVTFMPVTNNILGCFKDDTIHIWKLETFNCLKQIFPDELKINNINTIAFTRNGRAMVVANSAGRMAVVSLYSGAVQKTFSLPEICSGVKHIDFLPQLFDGGANKILSVLSSDSVHMIDIETSTLLNTVMHSQGRISRLICSPHGKYITCILQSGEVNIHSSDQLLIREEKEEKISTKTQPRNIYKKQYENQLVRVHDQINKVLDINRLLPLLKQYGEYPANYRSLVWKTILQLPGNHTAYATLVDKGTHPAYIDLNQTYPLKNQSLLKSLKRLLSCLSYWCPLFSQVMYMPVFVFPFLKVFKYDQQVCFEVVASIIVNWCQFWFEYFPFPPVNVLNMIENILVEHDPDLVAHLTEYQISSRIFAWPLMETAFSEVLSAQDWLRFWDHVLSNHPSFLIMAVAAFNIAVRTSLISMMHKQDFENFFRKESLNVKVLIKKTYQLMSSMSAEYHPNQYIKPYQGLLKGSTYQEYTQYPKNILDSQIDKLNEMRKEETQLIQEQKEILRKKVEKETAKQEQKQAITNEARLLELKEIYNRALRDEEARITDHRRKIADLRHELKKQEYNSMEEAKIKMINHKTTEKKKELERLLTDIDHKRIQDELEIQAIEQETRSYHLELLKRKEKLELQLGLEAQSPDFQYLALKRQQQILSKQLKKLREEASSGFIHRQMELTTYTEMVDKLLQRVELELARDMAERQSNLERRTQETEVMQLEAETKALDQEVEVLLEEIISNRENELCRKTSKLYPKVLSRNHSNDIHSKSSTRPYRNHHNDNYDPIKAALDVRRKIIMNRMHRDQS